MSPELIGVVGFVVFLVTIVLGMIIALRKNVGNVPRRVSESTSYAPTACVGCCLRNVKNKTANDD